MLPHRHQRAGRDPSCRHDRRHLCRCSVPHKRVRLEVVVVVSRQPACAGRQPGCRTAPISELVAQRPIERIDERILLGLSRIDVVPLDSGLAAPFRTARLVNSVPLWLTAQAGLPYRGTSVSSSRATLTPEVLMSPTRHRFSRHNSSLIARMRSRREALNVSATKSIDQRSFGRSELQDRVVQHALGQQSVAGLSPCLRQTSAVGNPASCSLNMPII